jgi:hypothetical protein
VKRLFPLLLLAACAAEPPPEPTPTPPPDEPDLVVLEPGTEAANPVTFRVSAPPETVRVQYVVDFAWTAGESTDPAGDFAVTAAFDELGDHRVEILAFDADGDRTGRLLHDVHVLPDPNRPNRFGVVLGDVQAQGWEHAALAARLGALGIDRAYLHVADGVADCAANPLPCDEAVVGHYTDVGIEVWAWATPAIGDERAQADLVFDLIPLGYRGLVLRFGEPYRGQDQPLDEVLLAWLLARNECAGFEEHDGVEFPILAWVPSDPAAAGLATAVLDDKAEGLLPLADAGVEDAVCAWAATTARPVHGFLPLDAPDLGAALLQGGRSAAVLGVPDAGDDAGWAAFEALPWTSADFTAPACD